VSSPQPAAENAVEMRMVLKSAILRSREVMMAATYADGNSKSIKARLCEEYVSLVFCDGMRYADVPRLLPLCTLRFFGSEIEIDQIDAI
jgi:hypothetical protein